MQKQYLFLPAKNIDKTIVYGVNHRDLVASDTIVSYGSCTTNCFAPIAKVLHDATGINFGIMTTIHSYTRDQSTLDRKHDDLHRARAEQQCQSFQRPLARLKRSER